MVDENGSQGSGVSICWRTTCADKIVHATGAVRIRLLDELLRTIARHRIGNRLRRVKLRVVKRRPKAFPSMTAPRATTLPSAQ